MRHTDLQAGDVFTIDGKYYEFIEMWGRMIHCYKLQEAGDALTEDGLVYGIALERVLDFKDEPADEVFSDMRFDSQHMTQEEREEDALIASLL